jgi:hypothetical protein
MQALDTSRLQDEAACELWEICQVEHFFFVPSQSMHEELVSNTSMRSAYAFGVNLTG